MTSSTLNHDDVVAGGTWEDTGSDYSAGSDVKEEEDEEFDQDGERARM